MELQGLAPFFRPRLRLFFSVDLVGSTALKQREDRRLSEPASACELTELGADWFRVFATFYNDIERYFAEEWSEAVKGADGTRLGRAPEVWKANGDELLFTKTLTSPDDAHAAVRAWMNALKRYRPELKRDEPRLDVKSAVWSAGFPYGNAEIVFPSANGGQAHSLAESISSHYQLLDRWYGEGQGRHGLTMDFVGPAIDTGFRIAATATPRRLTLSVEAALLLADVSMQRNDEEKLPFHYEGRSPLKGVLDDKPYPIFWIDMLPDDPVLRIEDRINGTRKAEAEQVRQFCNAFLAENRDRLISPFIVGEDGAELFSSPPPGYEGYIHRQNGVWLAEKGKLDLERRGIEGADAPDGESESGFEDHQQARRVAKGLLSRPQR